MLDEIRASGETQNSACDVFNANLGECSVCTCGNMYDCMSLCA